MSSRARFRRDSVFRLTDLNKDEVVTNCDHLRKLRFSPALPLRLLGARRLMAAGVLKSELGP